MNRYRSITNVIILALALLMPAPGLAQTVGPTVGQYWKYVTLPGGRAGGAWRTPQMTLPLSYNLGTGSFSIGGLSTLGGSNQLVGVEAGGGAWEFKTVTAGTNVNVSHSAGAVTISVPSAAPSGAAGGILGGTYPNPTLGGLSTLGGSNQLLGMAAGGSTAEFKTLTAGTNVNVSHSTGAVTISVPSAAPSGAAAGDLAGTYPNPTIASGKVAKSVNGLFDNITLAGTGGNTVSVVGQTITIAGPNTTTELHGEQILGALDSTVIQTTYCDTSWTGTASFVFGSGGIGTLQLRFYTDGKVVFYSPDAQEISGVRFHFNLYKKQYPSGGVY